MRNRNRNRNRHKTPTQKKGPLESGPFGGGVISPLVAQAAARFASAGQ
tara:strand:+ start:207 stop:350 length:144 start_codon:yes stop_codon:yes gene_type:complete